MSRIVRLSLALLFALMMVIATASAGLAFDPGPSSNVDGLCAFAFPGISDPGNQDVVDDFVAKTNGGPWHATGVGPNPNPSGEEGPSGGPISFNDNCK